MVTREPGRALPPGPACEAPTGVDEAIARAQGWLDAATDAGHHLTARTRGTLARVLFHLERGNEAYEQVRAMGEHAAAYPWRYWGHARDEFLTYRSHIVTMAAGAS